MAAMMGKYIVIAGVVRVGPQFYLKNWGLGVQLLLERGWWTFTISVGPFHFVMEEV